jgi:hypothetical protein
MGTFIGKHHFQRDGRSDSSLVNPSWYFDDIYFSYKGWEYNWPSENFPFKILIHNDNIHKDKVSIRRYIERYLEGTVIYELIDRSYFVRTDRYGDGYEMRNWWNIFYFETEQDSLAFKIRFSDIISDEMTDKHPENKE